MKKIFILSLALISSSFAFYYERLGLEVTIEKNDEDKTLLIKRVKPKECNEIGFNPTVILGENHASKDISENCKKTFVSAAGRISPIKFSDKIDTFGELEVLKFIDDAQYDDKMLLIDSRTPVWYEQQTIPTAVNVPYTYLNESKFPGEFDEMLELLGVKTTDNGYDFSEAKELLLFCNAIWCGQSPESMKKLIKIGYPEEKLNWYRGGIQSWLSLNLPTIKP